MTDGRALLARTKITSPDGAQQVHLKLVFLNPMTTKEEIDEVLTGPCLRYRRRHRHRSGVAAC